MTSINDKNMFDILGEFSFISITKILHQEITQKEFDFMNEMHNLPPQEIDQRSKIFFSQLPSDDERRRQILRQATDLHESHHFHSFLLLPVGKVIFNLFINFLYENTHIFETLKLRMQNKVEPFSIPLKVSFPPGVLELLNYYLATSLPLGELLSQTGSNPITFKYNFGTQNKPAFLPVVLLDNSIYPLGLLPIFESWTQSLVEACVFRQHSEEYFQWYRSTKKIETAWPYKLLEHILLKIFGEAFEKLDPLSKYTFIAYISISASTIDPRPTEDFFQRQLSHPGWQLTEIIETLWENRSFFLNEKQLDLSKLLRILPRLNLYDESRNASQHFFLVDHFVELRVSEIQNLEDNQSLISQALSRFNKLQVSLIRLFLINPSIFLDAAEWLISVRLDILPRIPMAIAKTQNNVNNHIAFPSGNDSNFWFTWFFSTQLLSLLSKEITQCPLDHYNIDMKCPRDSSCATMSNILSKGKSCYINQLFSS